MVETSAAAQCRVEHAGMLHIAGPRDCCAWEGMSRGDAWVAQVDILPARHPIVSK